MITGSLASDEKAGSQPKMRPWMTNWVVPEWGDAVTEACMKLSIRHFGKYTVDGSSWMSVKIFEIDSEDRDCL